MLLSKPWLGIFLFTISLCVIVYKHFNPSCVHPPAPKPISAPNKSNELKVSNKTIPLSVNYHFTRKCSYECGFCFHTDTNSYIAPLEDAKVGLLRLSQAGMKNVNFAGGEPFLYASMLGKMVDYCKQELKLESVSIVSNGSKITESWIRAHASNVDILAISCDSFDETTNIQIGRGTGTHISQLYRVAEWCREYGVMFKLNSVICRYNFDEDMNRHIAALQPYRCDDEFDAFCAKHAAQKCIVPESNKVMAKSYLILDERLHFLDRSGKKPSQSIVQVGVEEALDSVFWDMSGFKERGGIFAWNEDLAKNLKEGKSAEAGAESWEVLIEKEEGKGKDEADLKGDGAKFDARHQVMGGGGCGGAGTSNGTGNGSSADLEDIGKKAKKE
ncbi:hypothetical protein LTR84_010884 [Exophiala bonariae]|uniref:Radical SAM core domain-containing protein n=1 Tax=Exophiala bonariae TaxID=1690606 RepID=A0AAV9NJ77_9EURO|nr:hypothetical protein LTR84_010884 [Exophiala bonariae]